MKAMTIGAFEAKTHLSKLLDKVRNGQSFFITKRGRRVAELRPISQPDQHPQFGCDKGKIHIADDFDSPIPGMEDYL